MVAGSRAAQRPASPSPAARRTLRGRVLLLALGGFSAVLQRLPVGLLHRLAHAGGWLLYRTQRERRELARGNLRHVCRYLAASGLVGPASPAAAAAQDDGALERLLRAAFGHYVRGYLEVALLPGFVRRGASVQMPADEPGLVDQAFGRIGARHGPLIVVGMHFGAIEIPGLWTSQHGLQVTAPMETVPDADLQAYMARSRGASGLRLVPSRGAGRELSGALTRGEVVALVADRVVEGSGARVDLFGRPTRLPLGPAVLALESGAPAWLVTTRRARWGSYRVHLEHIEVPAEGTRRQRLDGFLSAQVSAFERAVAQAPEQWWAIFFPIWRARASQPAVES